MTETNEKLIYHITPIDNLPSIIAEGGLWSDYQVLQRNQSHTVIGYDTIKRRRLEQLRVSCHPTTFVGQYVPFYFCPRSPMLFVISSRNADLTYQHGQDRIVHLVSKIGVGIRTAGDRSWAFSDGNAGARYARFCNNLEQIDDYVDWNSVGAHYWSDPTTKERKQAEFLVYDSFAWNSIIGIGAIQQEVADEVQTMIANVDHKPEIVVKPGWYY
ncbi:DUF4433 domain-containing protein [Mariniblastus sp.]|nr:DUF4433 domain-containing protein [Mariniblastus sp.]